MKPEKKSWTRALFAYAGGEKKKLVLSVVLSVLSVTLGLAPFTACMGCCVSSQPERPHRPRFVKPVRAKIQSPAPCADKEKPGI